MSCSIKLKTGEPLTRKLFKAINEFILNISIFYDITKISLNSFLNAIKQNPNLSFTIIKYNVKYKTLRELEKKQEQLSIDEYKTLNSQYGLNCVRAYIYPELTYDYKKWSDIKLIKIQVTQSLDNTFLKQK